MTGQEPEHVVTKSIVVARDVHGAFQTWTGRIREWWPSGHSLSGDPRTQVYIEGALGGRFYERTSDGVEYEWGRVLVWEPPHRLCYSWYLGSSQELPTRVEVRFVPLEENRTRVDITHRGPELVGDLWWLRQSRYAAAWDTVLDAYSLAE